MLVRAGSVFVAGVVAVAAGIGSSGRPAMADSGAAVVFDASVVAELQAAGIEQVLLIADGGFCGVVDVASAPLGRDLEVSFEFGVRDAACYRPGAVMVFVEKESGRVFAATGVVSTEQPVRLTSSAFAAKEGPTSIVLPRYVRNTLIQELQVSADGELCGEIDLSSFAPGDALPVGLALDGAGVPAACSRDGSELVLVIPQRSDASSRARTLAFKPRVVRGERIVVTGLGVPPPHEQFPVEGDATREARKRGLAIALGLLLATGAAALLVGQRSQRRQT